MAVVCCWSFSPAASSYSGASWQGLDDFVCARARLEETAARLQRLLEFESTEASPTAARERKRTISTQAFSGDGQQQPAASEDKDPGEDLAPKRRQLLAHAQHPEL